MQRFVCNSGLVIVLTLTLPSLTTAASFTADAGLRRNAFSGNSACPGPPGEGGASCIFTGATSNGIGTSYASASASAGQLRGLVTYEVRNNKTFQQFGTRSQAGAFSRSTAVIDDVVFSGDGATVFAQPNIRAQGIVTSTPGPHAVESIDGSFRVTIRGPGVNRQWFQGGFGNGTTLDLPWQLGTMEFQTDTAYTIEMSLELEAEVSDWYGPEDGPPGTPAISSRLDMNFANTIGFVLGEAAFSLPEGFTVNSALGSIVDNVFVPIPEPATSSLLLLVAAVGMSARQFRNDAKPR